MHEKFTNQKFIIKKGISKMLNYLVTGGAGFIGSNLVEKLLKKENKVIVIDNFCDFYNPKIKEENIKEFLTNSNFRLYREDIRNRKELNKIFKENKIDIVIHLAAMSGVRTSIQNPCLYQEVNVWLSIHRLCLCVMISGSVQEFIRPPMI